MTSLATRGSRRPLKRDFRRQKSRNPSGARQSPVAAIRAFLAGSTAPEAPWLGIRGEPAQGDVRGVRVLAIASSSPAAEGSV
jgi:hypothetical protein